MRGIKHRHISKVNYEALEDLRWVIEVITCSLCRFQEDGEVKYLEEARDLIKPERNTLEVSFVDIEKFNQNLTTLIVEEFYR